MVGHMVLDIGQNSKNGSSPMLKMILLIEFMVFL